MYQAVKNIWRKDFKKIYIYIYMRKTISYVEFPKDILDLGQCTVLIS